MSEKCVHYHHRFECHCFDPPASVLGFKFDELRALRQTMNALALSDMKTVTEWLSVMIGGSPENSWRSAAVRYTAQVEDLKHEVGCLREIIRRIVGYVDSVRSSVGMEGRDE